MIGGGLRMADPIIWPRLAALSGGVGAGWVVLSTASERPRQMGRRLGKALARQGVCAQVLPVAPRWPGTDPVAAAHDPQGVDAVAQARGVFFSGGAQARIAESLMPEGRDTPLLSALRELQARGGVLAGTSAGAAIMSRVMFRDAPSVLGALRGELREGVEFMTGLGFIGHELLVDQHFLQRGRLGRLIALMVRCGFRRGLGVDERAAVQVQNGVLEVFGRGGAVLVDMTGAHCQGGQRQGQALCVQGVRLSYLEPGDRHDLTSHRTLPGPCKVPATGPVPLVMRASRAPAPIDMLGRDGLTLALRRLLSHPKTWQGQERRGGVAIASGWASEGHAASQPSASAFEFRLRTDARSQVWKAMPGTEWGQRVVSPGVPVHSDAITGFTLAGALLDILPLSARAGLTSHAFADSALLL